MGLFSGLFGGGSHKTKIKREIPKPTQEEMALLDAILGEFGIVPGAKEQHPRGYTILPELENRLRHPYQALKSPLGQALMEVALKGYSEPLGLRWMEVFSSMPRNWFGSGNMFRYGMKRQQDNIWDMIASYGEV